MRRRPKRWPCAAGSWPASALRPQRRPGQRQVGWARRLPGAELRLAGAARRVYTGFQEHIKGQLRPGYLADFVLLSADVFSLPPEALLEVRPLLTICDGEIVFEA